MIFLLVRSLCGCWILSIRVPFLTVNWVILLEIIQRNRGLTGSITVVGTFHWKKSNGGCKLALILETRWTFSNRGLVWKLVQRDHPVPHPLTSSSEGEK